MTENAGQHESLIIFDTTLRDGEQSPGASMNLAEKLEVAHALKDLGVDIIEGGFPIASPGDFEAVHEIAKVARRAVVCGLARAAAGDIDRAAEALQPAERRRIHTFISTSPLHMRVKLQMEPEEVIEKIAESVTRARRYTDDVEWSPEDGTRTEHDFLCRAVETAIRAGAATINIPDTVGYTVPEEYGSIFRMLLERVPGADTVRFSVHCHDDLGLAVANSLAGVCAGARQVECTVNGLGERAGNAALEEVVMAIRTRSDRLPFWTGIDTRMLTRASKLVSAVSAFPVQYNKAIVGKNAFAHEAGIHQDGMLKDAQTYEIMRPEDVGVAQTSIVMGKHSGRHAFREKLKELGYELAGAQDTPDFDAALDPDRGRVAAITALHRPHEQRGVRDVAGQRRGLALGRGGGDRDLPAALGQVERRVEGEVLRLELKVHVVQRAVSVGEPSRASERAAVDRRGQS